MKKCDTWHHDRVGDSAIWRTNARHSGSGRSSAISNQPRRRCPRCAARIVQATKSASPACARRITTVTLDPSKVSPGRIANHRHESLPKRRLVEAAQFARMERVALALQQFQRGEADLQMLADRPLVKGVRRAR